MPGAGITGKMIGTVALTIPMASIAQPSPRCRREIGAADAFCGNAKRVGAVSGKRAVAIDLRS
jgi:hypothetical protein